MAEFYCGKCAWLDEKNKERYTSLERYWCDKKGGYHKLTEQGCNGKYFINDPKKSQTDNKGYTPSGCYITTIVCNILGYEDNCELLTILRDFRDNYLKTKPEYLQLLLEYDSIGPIISRSIASRIDNYNFCLLLLNEFLLFCVDEIKNGNIEEAVSIYKNMVNYLQEELEIPSIKIPEELKYDIETLGKGRIRLLSEN